MSIYPVTTIHYWNINYADPLSIGWNPACWNTSWQTYEIILQNHSAGWTCAINAIVDPVDVFNTQCSGKTISSGDLIKVTTIAHYDSWQKEYSKYIVA